MHLLQILPRLKPSVPHNSSGNPSALLTPAPHALRHYKVVEFNLTAQNCTSWRGCWTMGENNVSTSTNTDGLGARRALQTVKAFHRYQWDYLKWEQLSAPLLNTLLFSLSFMAALGQTESKLYSPHRIWDGDVSLQLYCWRKKNKNKTSLNNKHEHEQDYHLVSGLCVILGLLQLSCLILKCSSKPELKWIDFLLKTLYQVLIKD